VLASPRLPPATLPVRVNDLVVDHHARVLVLEDVALGLILAPRVILEARLSFGAIGHIHLSSRKRSRKFT
jgi:hypothetical protein